MVGVGNLSESVIGWTALRGPIGRSVSGCRILRFVVTVFDQEGHCMAEGETS
jgi:hypothetical protein